MMETSYHAYEIRGSKKDVKTIRKVVRKKLKHKRSIGSFEKVGDEYRFVWIEDKHIYCNGYKQVETTTYGEALIRWGYPGVKEIEA